MLDHYSPEDFLSGRCAADQVGSPKPPLNIEQYMAASPPPPLIHYDPYDPIQAKMYDAVLCAEQIAAWGALSKTGNVQASKEARNWQQRRAALLGLDAPVKAEVVTIARQLDYAKLPTAELERLLAEMTAIPGESTREE
jgi:hypothetical protein